MRTVALSKRSRNTPLHIEAPGCIINVYMVHDDQGRDVTAISISSDGGRYAGEPKWWIEGKPGHAGLAVRVIKTTES